MYKIYTAVVSLSFEGFFPLHHKSHHSFITNLRILKNEGVTAPSSPSIKPQAAHVDSRRGSGRLAFPSAIYRSHFWCMNKGVSPFPSLLVNSFYSPQFVDFSVGKAGGRGGGRRKLMTEEETEKVHEKKLWYIMKTLEKNKFLES